MSELKELEEKVEIAICKLKKELLEKYSDDHDTATLPTVNKIKIMVDIEAVAHQVLLNLAEKKPMLFSVQNNTSWEHINFNEKLRFKSGSDSALTKVNFNDERSRMKFSVIYLLLSEIHKLLDTNEKSTTREIFYKYKDWISTEKMLVGFLNNVSCMLQVSIYKLNIVTSSKGLVYGPLKIIIENDEFDCSKGKGVLIPDNIFDAKELRTEATYVLIVEKNSIFKKLIYNSANKLLSTILITGKGYPDTKTRILVRQIWDTLHIPILILTDPDPWGIEIMCVYRYGSLTMAFEAENLAIPSMRWLGVHPSDLDQINKKEPLRMQDKKKLKNLLERPYILSNDNIKKEIECMKDTGTKAELEDVPYLAQEYIPKKIACAKMI